MTKPTKPVVRSANKMDRALFTKVFPSSRVHSNKFPCLRNGSILLAYSLSFGSPALSNTFNETMSRLNSPRVRPLNMADNKSKMGAKESEAARGMPPPLEDFATSYPSSDRQWETHVEFTLSLHWERHVSSAASAIETLVSQGNRCEYYDVLFYNKYIPICLSLSIYEQ